MTAPSQSRLILALGLLFSLPIVGAAVGGIVGGLIASGMGWDRIADVLGGLLAGAAVGLVTAIMLILRGPTVWVRRIAIVGLGLSMVLLILLAWRLRSLPSS